MLELLNELVEAEGNDQLAETCPCDAFKVCGCMCGMDPVNPQDGFLDLDENE